jgi:STAT protein, DNA binding domain
VQKFKQEVTDRKYVFLFYASLPLGNNGVPCWTFSLPVVITVQSGQYCKAWGTIFWSLAFSEPVAGGDPSGDKQGAEVLEASETVPYSEVAKKLPWIFRKLTETTRELSCADLQYLSQYMGGYKGFVSMSKMLKVS